MLHFYNWKIQWNGTKWGKTSAVYAQRNKDDIGAKLMNLDKTFNKKLQKLDTKLHQMEGRMA